MSWDLNLCMNWRKEPLVPFTYFAAPNPPSSPTILKSFPRFLDLPLDIHLLIYKFCDASTLFQLMHTCSSTRIEASKLFWAHQDIWYHCPDDWLCSHSHKYRHPLVRHCPDFASRIAQVELYLGRLEWEFKEGQDPDDERQRMSTADKARFFWSAVQELFPSVRRVVLTGLLPRRDIPPRNDEYDDEYSPIALAVRQAPPNIVVFVAFAHTGPAPNLYRTDYRLWRVGAGLKPSWQIVEESWTPKRVLLPSKKLSNGPLGEYETMQRKKHLLWLEQAGLRWLRVETYARYPLGSVIECPNPDCDARFTEKIKWNDHIHSARHDLFNSSRGLKGRSHCCERTPAEVQAALEERHDRISAGWKHFQATWMKLRNDWGGEGTEKRRRFRETFFAQLREENFLTPGELPEQSSIWIEGFCSYFDPTHVYYSPAIADYKDSEG